MFFREGVAGGVFLADGIRSLFGGGSRAYASGNDITSAGDQAQIDKLQDEAQDARDDADQSNKDLAADDASLDDMGDEPEQRATLDALMAALNEEPLSDRPRFR